MRLPIAATLLALITLTGCSLTPTSPYQATATTALGVAIHGRTMGGQQPISGSHIYLFAAASTGYAAASTSLLTAAQTGQSDTTGAYVLSDSGGNFSLPAGYACTTGTQTYLYALGGNPGAGINSAAGLLAVLGNCPAAGNLDAIPNVVINEASTVAAAFALAGFAKDATHIGSSNSTQGQLGLANSFALAANLEDIGSPLGGLALTPAGNGTAPQAKINTLANILASCVNSASSTSANCNTLFINSRNVQTPTNTANAAINIAHSPANNVATLFTLNTGTPAFSGSLGSAPSDFTMTITYTNPNLARPNNLAVDIDGNIGIANIGNTHLTRIGPLGVQVNDFKFNTAQAAGVAFSIDNDIFATSSNSSYVYYINTANQNYSFNYSATYPTINNLIAEDGSDQYWSSAINALKVGILFEIGQGGTAIDFTGSIVAPYAVAADITTGAWYTSFNPASPATSGSATLLYVYYNASNTSVYYRYCTGANYTAGSGIALDNTGNVWISDYTNGAIVEFSNTCAYKTSYTTGGLANSKPLGITIDGAQNIWTLTSNNTLVGFSNSGTILTGTSGLVTGLTGTPAGPVVDPSGNIWFASATGNTLSTMVGAATPVTTPFSTAIANGTLATKP